jgi:hypothetical protein
MERGSQYGQIFPIFVAGLRTFSDILRGSHLLIEMWIRGRRGGNARRTCEEGRLWIRRRRGGLRFRALDARSSAARGAPAG